ncbi:MAG: hypothetical protein AB7R89_33390 [Dehalococcoidia bacterium]
MLVLRPSHAWWALVDPISSLEEVAHAAAWNGPEAAGDWQAAERTFREGHTETWWELEVRVGP